MTPNQLHTRKCTTCQYTALITRSRHYESSCEQKVDTVKCSRCNQLSVVPVTKVATYPHPTREEFRLIYDADKKKYFRDFELCYQMYDPPRVCEKLEKIHCLWCNSTRTRSWSAESSECPRCGSLMKESDPELFEITNINTYKSFEEMASSAPNVIAVCLEDWCISCQILHPVINQIQKEFPGVFHFVKFGVNYAEKNDLFHKFHKKVFPFLILYKHAKLVTSISSPDTKDELVKKLRKYYELN